MFRISVLAISDGFFVLQGPAQAQNLRDSLAEAKSDIVVKVSSSPLILYLNDDT